MDDEGKQALGALIREAAAYVLPMAAWAVDENTPEDAFDKLADRWRTDLFIERLEAIGMQIINKTDDIVPGRKMAGPHGRLP